MARSALLAPVVALAVSLFLPLEFWWPAQDVELSVADMFPKLSQVTLLDNVNSVAPADMLVNGKYSFGRYSKPILRPDFHSLTLAQTVFQKKEWSFFSFTSDRYLVGIAIGNVGYIGSSFVYVFDKKFGNTTQVSELSPLALRASVSPSSISGCSTWTRPLSKMPVNSHCYDGALGGSKVLVDATLDNGMTLSLDIQTTLPPQSFALVFPLGPRRPSYTHKAAGFRSKGSLKLNGKAAPFAAVGLSDWTRGLHRRLTLWFWVGLSLVTEEGVRLGLQLSTGVYQNSAGMDLENVAWVDDEMSVLDFPIQWSGTPGNGDLQPGKVFQIKTKDGETLKLDYTMQNEVLSSAHAGSLISTDLKHTFGIYNGQIKIGGRTHIIRNAPGILEDHYARW